MIAILIIIICIVTLVSLFSYDPTTLNEMMRIPIFVLQSIRQITPPHLTVKLVLLGWSLIRFIQQLIIDYFIFINVIW